MPTIQVGDIFDGPGSQVRVPVVLDNTDGVDMVAFQFNIDTDPAELIMVDYDNLNTDIPLEMQRGPIGESTRFVGYSFTNALMIPERVKLFDLIYDVDPVVPLGGEALVTMANTMVIAPDATKISHVAIDGAVRLGVRGDLNFDGDIDIGDAVRLVGHIIGVYPFTGHAEIPDYNADGNTNVNDVLGQITYILG